MGELYDTDVLEWSEHQVALLRRHAVGQLSNETPDWANIIEEVESVGRSQLSAVKRRVAFGGMRRRPSRRPCAGGSTWRAYTAGRWTVCPTASTVSRPCRSRRFVP